jgi:hypothetical protein
MFTRHADRGAAGAERDASPAGPPPTGVVKVLAVAGTRSGEPAFAHEFLDACVIGERMSGEFAAISFSTALAVETSAWSRDEVGTSLAANWSLVTAADDIDMSSATEKMLSLGACWQRFALGRKTAGGFLKTTVLKKYWSASFRENRMRKGTPPNRKFSRAPVKRFCAFLHIGRIIFFEIPGKKTKPLPLLHWQSHRSELPTAPCTATTCTFRTLARLESQNVVC